MNRMTPLITRRFGPVAAAAPMPKSWLQQQAERESGAGASEDLKLFATAWAGGLIFFGTFLG